MNKTQFIDSETIKKTIAFIESGKCRPGKIFDFSNSTVFTDDVANLFNTLLSDKCPANLTFNFENTRIGAHAIDIIIEIIESNYCPKGLTLNLSANSLSDHIIKRFAAAIRSGKCPTDLTIVLENNHATEFGYGAREMANALQSGIAPEGTKIIGLGTRIEDLCQQNDIRIIQQKHIMLMTQLAELCLASAPWVTNTAGLDGFHGSVFWQTTASLVGTNPNRHTLLPNHCL